MVPAALFVVQLSFWGELVSRSLVRALCRYYTVRAHIANNVPRDTCLCVEDADFDTYVHVSVRCIEPGSTKFQRNPPLVD